MSLLQLHAQALNHFQIGQLSMDLRPLMYISLNEPCNWDGLSIIHKVRLPLAGARRHELARGVSKRQVHMKPDVELFFTDPADLTQKHKKQLTQVMDFQKNHRRRLNAYIREQMSKQGKVIEISQKNISHFHEMERQIKELKEENIYLKKLITDKGIGGSSRPGTPGRGMSSSPGGYRASPGSVPHQQNSSPYRGQPNTTGALRNFPADTPQSQPIKPVPPQPMVASTPPSSLSRVSVRTPPANGRMGSIPRTPSPRVQIQLRPGGIRPPTPGTGDSYRRDSPGFHLHSSSPMSVGTPHTIQVPAPQHSTMSQYRQLNTGMPSPGFAIHTPRGADTAVM